MRGRKPAARAYCLRLMISEIAIHFRLVLFGITGNYYLVMAADSCN